MSSKARGPIIDLATLTCWSRNHKAMHARFPQNYLIFHGLITQSQMHARFPQNKYSMCWSRNRKAMHARFPQNLVFHVLIMQSQSYACMPFSSEFNLPRVDHEMAKLCMYDFNSSSLIELTFTVILLSMPCINQLSRSVIHFSVMYLLHLVGWLSITAWFVWDFVDRYPRKCRTKQTTDWICHTIFTNFKNGFHLIFSSKPYFALGNET